MKIIECYDFLKRDRLIVTWTMNLSCNYNCFYCDIHNNNPNPNYLLVDKIVSYINYIGRKRRVLLKVGGGESTLCDDFVHVIHSLNINSIIIITNFHKPIDFWKELYLPNISLHLSYHYRMIDQNEYFEKCKKLIEIGYKNIVSLVMFYPFDKKEIMKFYLKLKTLESPGIFTVLPRTIRYHDMLQDYRLLTWINNTYPKELYIKCNTSKKVIEQFVSSEEIKNTGGNKFKFFRCDCGKNNLSIGPQGTVYYCEAYRQQNVSPIFNLENDNYLNYDYILDGFTICRVDECLCELFVPKKQIVSRI